MIVERCNPENLERAADGRGAALWILTTPHPLKCVLREGYFETVAEHGLRRHDRIWVNASAAEDTAEYASLVVTTAEPLRKGGIAVRRLQDGGGTS
jgi:hypothetical protein